MLNDVKTPPPMPRDDQPGLPPVAPTMTTTRKLAEDVHTDPQEPGTHHARIFGEKTHLDPEYAMPLEDRGSTFSIGLTLAAGALVIAVLICVYVAIR